MEGQPEKDFFSSLWVVLVIYKMKISESPTYQSLTSALQHCNKSISLFIYDNSPRAQEVLTNSLWRTHYQHDPSNNGVSKAYNEGFKKAKSENKSWMLLLDQDTTFTSDILDSYEEACKKNSLHEIFAPIVKNEMKIISPFRFSLGRGASLSNIHGGTYSINDLRFINSGLLISVRLFEKCSGYDEGFPLDFSDLSFAWRVKKFQNEFVVVDRVCSHSLSSSEKSSSMMLSRFQFFLRSSRLYGKLYSSSFFLFLNRFFRAMKLSYKFRSWEFVLLFIRIERERTSS
ncbi:MAG: glycosyltransferase [Bacteroidetes bacterium]|nr:glycosyltransferase [Bacteroidota bacterium]